jgi:hypothetical protein
MTAASTSCGIAVGKTARKKDLQTSVGGETPSRRRTYSLVRSYTTIGRYSGDHICVPCN